MTDSLVLALQETAPVAAGYTAGEVMMFFGAVGILVPIVAAAVVSIIVSLRTGPKLDVAAKKADTLIASVERVHDATNSGLTAVRSELTTANALNMQLRDIITDLKSERAKGEVARALATPVPSAVSEQLEQIEVNTAETAANTRTP